jgi:hypothetical protein
MYSWVFVLLRFTPHLAWFRGLKITLTSAHRRLPSIATLQEGKTVESEDFRSFTMTMMAHKEFLLEAPPLGAHIMGRVNLFRTHHEHGDDLYKVRYRSFACTMQISFH